MTDYALICREAAVWGEYVNWDTDKRLENSRP